MKKMLALFIGSFMLAATATSATDKEEEEAAMAAKEAAEFQKGLTLIQQTSADAGQQNADVAKADAWAAFATFECEETYEQVEEILAGADMNLISGLSYYATGSSHFGAGQTEQNDGDFEFNGGHWIKAKSRYNLAKDAYEDAESSWIDSEDAFDSARVMYEEALEIMAQGCEEIE